MKDNLLLAPLIRTDRGRHSLPGLLAAMTRGEVAAFPALRPHQRPAWHMFLVQLAALALSGQGDADLPDDEDAWRRALRGLTRDFADDAPWHLVVEDASSPAFLQPADPGGLKWSPVATPDALDMLITSRNHDLKREIAHEAEPQDWVFALISLQTMEGFGGAGNYGIARMNGGSSSRVLLTLAPAGDGGQVVDPSAWWRRDVTRLLTRRGSLSGHALLWCLPWPERQMLRLDQLDPLFIEVCRRVRLFDGPEGLHALRTTSKSARIDAKDAKGHTGDPWAPVHLAEAKTLTLGERDWTYGLLHTLMFKDPREWQRPELFAQAVEGDDGPELLVAEAFARGNSKTDGFRSRVIQVPKTVRRSMLGTQAAKLSSAQIDAIARTETALRNGLAMIAAEGDREKLDKSAYARSLPAREALRRTADALFFPALWDELEATTTDARREMHLQFLRRLATAARAEFDRAAPGIPCASIMRHRAEVRGRAAFETGLRKVFDEIDAREFDHV